MNKWREKKKKNRVAYPRPETSYRFVERRRRREEQEEEKMRKEKCYKANEFGGETDFSNSPTNGWMVNRLWLGYFSIFDPPKTNQKPFSAFNANGKLNNYFLGLR